MEIQFENKGILYRCDLSKGIDLSISYKEEFNQVNCFYAPFFSSQAVKQGTFIGSVKDGGPVNYYNTFINIHGGGTHTEGFGHINKQRDSINSKLKSFFGFAYLLSVYPTKMENGDRVITSVSMQLLLEEIDIPEYLIVRTLPNTNDKMSSHYSGTNPPYVSFEAIQCIKEFGIKHLLIDLPSVDREEDGGKLLSHNCFWEGNRADDCTITELIYVPNHIKDGLYLMNLQVASMEQDAAPSRPVIYNIYEQVDSK
ncbi:MAG: cyclase family protein [Saprospiraceae bacterium]|nr:cyclase family protein [Saprospiraceae bacterium]